MFVQYVRWPKIGISLSTNRLYSLMCNVLNPRANLLSLEQRRTLQLLHLMFIHKENVDNLRIPERNTRAAQRDQLYVER